MQSLDTLATSFKYGYLVVLTVDCRVNCAGDQLGIFDCQFKSKVSLLNMYIH